MGGRFPLTSARKWIYSAFMKIKKSDVGRWVTVKWDDVGRRDSILVEVDKTSGKVFEPYEGLHRIELHQIVEKRKHISVS